ncbi:MAG: helix-turn-helix domain-containing protein [Chloroflexota bacterium]|nr:helix-turn-helix domain-containing protein [Chloroflexota bacterium]
MVIKAERQLEFDDAVSNDLARVLCDMGTAEVARETGYDRRTVRRLKRGECRPSPERLPEVLAAAARHARETLGGIGWTGPEEDPDVIGLLAGLLDSMEPKGQRFLGDSSRSARPASAVTGRRGCTTRS